MAGDVIGHVTSSRRGRRVVSILGPPGSLGLRLKDAEKKETFDLGFAGDGRVGETRRLGSEMWRGDA